MFRIKVNPLLVAIFLSMVAAIFVFIMNPEVVPHSLWVYIAFLVSSITIILTFKTRKAKKAYWGLLVYIFCFGYMCSVAASEGWRMIPWNVGVAGEMLKNTLIICAALLLADVHVIRFLDAFFKLEITLRWKEAQTPPVSEEYQQGYQWSGGAKIQGSTPLQNQRRKSQPIPPLELPQQQ